MEITRTDRLDTTILAVSGRIGSDTCDTLSEALAGLTDKPAPGRVIVDLARASYVCSMGIGIMVWSAKKMRAMERELVLAGARNEVKRVLDTAGVGRIMKTYASLEEAG